MNACFYVLVHRDQEIVIELIGAGVIDFCGLTYMSAGN